MALQIAVIDDWQDVARNVVDWSVLESIGQVSFIHQYPADSATLATRLREFEVICVMRERTRFDEHLLGQLPKLKLLVTGGMRNAAIDLKAAAARGIEVCGSDSYKHAAPELTWTLIMAATRNLVAEANALRAGQWQQGLGGDLHGKTLAILGLGSIGQRVAQFGQVFGMRVIAWSENLTAERAAEAGVTYVSKQQLFEQADVLSVHLVLSDRSRGLDQGLAQTPAGRCGTGCVRRRAVATSTSLQDPGQCTGHAPCRVCQPTELPAVLFADDRRHSSLVRRHTDPALTVGASPLAKNSRPPRGVRQTTSSFTTIASKLAPTGDRAHAAEPLGMLSLATSDLFHRR